MIRDIIKENNTKRELLTMENKKVYEDILLYLRCSSIPEKDTEDTLLEILDHLLDAQTNGKTAQDVFEKDIRCYCDELVDSLPQRVSKHYWNLTVLITFVTFIVGLGSTSVISLVGSLFTSNEAFTSNTVSLPSFLIPILITYPAIFITFKSLKDSTFDITKKQKIYSFFKLWLLFMLFFGIVIGTQLLLNKYKIAVIILNPWIGLALSLLAYLVSKVIYKKMEF